MTNELEKQFFDTFGIEKVTTYSCYEYYTYERGIDIWGEHCEKYLKDGGECDNCDKKAFIQEYPQITDRILLELICIHIKYLTFGILSHNVEKLKNEILTDLRIKKDVGNIYNEVRTLFEEG